MRRYEAGPSYNRRFWEIELNGCAIRVCFGRVDSSGNGRQIDKTFETSVIARYDWEKRIRRKIAAGFALVAPKVDDKRERTTIELLGNEELERLMFEHPESDDAILVYGDWLAERGDPRGEVILLYGEMGTENSPQRYVELKDRAEKIVNSNKPSFFGPFTDHCDNVRIRWRLGYFDDVRVRRRGGVAMALTLGALVGAPAAQMMRVLTIEAFDDRAASALMSGNLPALRCLKLSAPLDGEPPALTETLSPLLSLDVAPRLTRLHFSKPPDQDLLAQVAVSPLAAQLTHITLSNCQIPNEVAGFLATHFPNLQHFELEHCSVSQSVQYEIRKCIKARQPSK